MMAPKAMNVVRFKACVKIIDVAAKHTKTDTADYQLILSPIRIFSFSLLHTLMY